MSASSAGEPSCLGVDIGCGPGNLYATLGGSPKLLIGVDISRTSCGNGAKNWLHAHPRRRPRLTLYRWVCRYCYLKENGKLKAAKHSAT